jgi:ubiquinone/menaquinone biosynthesis C-methylase UbiE
VKILEPHEVRNMEALKQRLKANWTAGDFGKIAKSYNLGSIEFVNRLEIAKGERVLDVACGTGNLAIPAAKRGADVVGIDIAPNLIEQARARAAEEGLKIRFDEGDAEQLPYENTSFDKVITMFGAIFTPRPEVVAAEMLRVTRSGGTIAMANWTSAGFVGQMFKLMGSFVPPPPDLPSPLLWGDASKVRERFGDGVSSVKCVPRIIAFRFDGMNPAEVVAFWRSFYGPTQRAFQALEGNVAQQNELQRALEDLWAKNNKATTSNSVHVESEYLEVVAERR